MAESITTKCPACSKTLRVAATVAGKMVKCPCGSSFKVPAKGGAAVAGKAAPIVPGRKAAAMAAQSGEEKRKVMTLAVVVIVALVVIVGGIIAMKTLGGGKPAGPVLGEDDTVESMISDEYGTEAREWLSGRKGRMMSGWSDSQAEYNIANWYKMGAKKVYAFGGMLTRVAAIELPEDKVQRKELIDWANKWHMDRAEIPMMKDVGQKYLLIRLKL